MSASTWADAPGPACPVLVVLGQQDTNVPYNLGLKYAHALGADVLIYPGMSHVGPLLSTRAVEVAREVLSWVERKADLRNDLERWHVLPLSSGEIRKVD